MAEPARLLVVALLFCFLVWKLRRLAGMVASRGTIRPKVRRPVAVKVVERAAAATADAGVAAGTDPGALAPDTPPPQEPIRPIDETQSHLRYGETLLRLIQQPEMRALLDASPQLKPSLRRLLGLLGADIPSELAPTPRPKQCNRPDPTARAPLAPGRSGQGLASTPDFIPGPWLTAQPPGAFAQRWSPWRLKGGLACLETRVHFVTIY